MKQLLLPYIPIGPETKTGQVGILGVPATVEELVGDTKAIIRIVPIATHPSLPGGEVFEAMVKDLEAKGVDTTLIRQNAKAYALEQGFDPSLDNQELLFCYIGPTKALAPNKAFPTYESYKVTGQIQHTMEQGAVTMFTMEQFDAGRAIQDVKSEAVSADGGMFPELADVFRTITNPVEVGDVINRLLPDAEIDQPGNNEVRRKNEFRTWSDVSGRFQVEAKLVTRGDAFVWLMKSDGSKVRVPLEKLSERDRKRLAQDGR